jgi:hypothetical protein
MPFECISSEPLDAMVNVRLTSKEKEKLVLDAQCAGLSVSALIRARYLGRPIIPDTDRATIRELRRLGGLLKQIQSQSRCGCSGDTAAALHAVSAAITRIAS